MTNPASLPAAAPYLHLLDAVRVVDHDWPEDGSVLVQPISRGVDRADGTGIAFRPAQRPLAARLRDVIMRGDAYGSAEVRTDADGRTYICAQHRFAVMEIEEDLDTLDRIGPLAGADHRHSDTSH